MIEDFLILIENIQEKKMQTQHPTYNVHMMMAEPHVKDHNINIVTRSGMAIGGDKGKQPKTDGWVCKVVEKEVGFDLNRFKETFMESKKNFTEASTSRCQEKNQWKSRSARCGSFTISHFSQNLYEVIEGLEGSRRDAGIERKLYR